MAQVEIPIQSGMRISHQHRGTEILGIGASGVKALFEDGTAAAPSIAFKGDSAVGFYRAYNANYITFVGKFRCSSGIFQVDPTDGIFLAAAGKLHWSASGDADAPGNVILCRDGSGILALKNGTNAQEFRVYGTTTGPKYLGFKHNGSNGLILCGEQLHLKNLAADAFISVVADSIQILSKFIGQEIATPASPPDGQAFLYFKDAGGGKTGLYVLFPTGAEQQIKVEA